MPDPVVGTETGSSRFAPSVSRVLLHRAGPALWPERYDEKALQLTKLSLGEYFFESLYQQSPVPREGGMFQEGWFRDNLVPSAPRLALRCRFWDLAASDGKGDYTVGTLMAAETGQGPFYIEHIVRGRWGVEETDRRVLATAERDARLHGPVAIRKEQEPGAAGKREAIGFVKMLAGYDVAFEPNSGSKEDRARPLASQCAIGNVKVCNPAAWEGCTFAEFLAEFAAFPGRGKHDDICDSVAGSFNAVALGGEPPGPCHVAGTAAALSLPGGFGMAPLF